jgi:hypothetical protein
VTEAGAILSAAVQRLASAGLTAWLERAPEGTSEPVLILSLGSAEDVLTGGEARGYAEGTLSATAWSLGESPAACLALIEAADAALHGALLTVGGRTVHLARISQTAGSVTDGGIGRSWATAVYRATAR